MQKSGGCTVVRPALGAQEAPEVPEALEVQGGPMPRPGAGWFAVTSGALKWQLMDSTRQIAVREHGDGRGIASWGSGSSCTVGAGEEQVGS